MLPQIDEKHFAIIRQIIQEILGEVAVRVYVFGSRAKNSADKYSDLDLAIECYDNNEMLSSKLLLKLAVAFENSLLPYKVDIVDLKKISKEFRSEIETDFIPIL
ncbi:MAG: nucleotidyltransferase domain-containing protein [Planctomycetaceae bacterium]|jgi:predicted nucleotidyltransferase|nr:nucleotidyltransferase domain-containing protein [Planctomycetaceae bacterium]